MGTTTGEGETGAGAGTKRVEGGTGEEKEAEGGVVARREDILARGGPTIGVKTGLIVGAGGDVRAGARVGVTMVGVERGMEEVEMMGAETWGRTVVGTGVVAGGRGRVELRGDEMGMVGGVVEWVGVEAEVVTGARDWVGVDMGAR